MSNLRKLLPVFYGTAFSGFSILLPHSAFAQAAPGTIGNIVNSVGTNIVNLPNLLTLIAYIVGLGFIIAGIKKLKNHADSPQQVSLSHGIARLLIGAAAMALPILAYQLAGTFGWGDANTDILAQKAQVLTSAGVAAGAAGQTSLNQMLYNFVKNVRGPLIGLIDFISYILGTWLIFKGLMKAVRYADDGPKGQPGMGIVALLSVGSTLMALPSVLQNVSKTLSMGTDNAQFHSMAFSASSGLTATPEMNMAVAAVFAFVQIIGLIGFVRGVNMLRVIGEGGSQQASMPAALTHIIGGAVAWNLVAFVKILSTTLGIDSGIV